MLLTYNKAGYRHKLSSHLQPVRKLIPVKVIQDCCPPPLAICSLTMCIKNHYQVQGPEHITYKFQTFFLRPTSTEKRETGITVSHHPSPKATLSHPTPESRKQP